MEQSSSVNQRCPLVGCDTLYKTYEKGNAHIKGQRAHCPARRAAHVSWLRQAGMRENALFAKQNRKGYNISCTRAALTAMQGAKHRYRLPIAVVDTEIADEHYAMYRGVIDNWVAAAFPDDYSPSLLAVKEQLLQHKTNLLSMNHTKSCFELYQKEILAAEYIIIPMMHHRGSVRHCMLVIVCVKSQKLLLLESAKKTDANMIDVRDVIKDLMAKFGKNLPELKPLVPVRDKTNYTNECVLWAVAPAVKLCCEWKMRNIIDDASLCLALPVIWQHYIQHHDALYQDGLCMIKSTLEHTVARIWRNNEGKKINRRKSRKRSRQNYNR